MAMGPGTVFVTVILAVLAVTLVNKAVYVVRQHERGLVETFGKYTRTVEPGLVLLVPFCQTLTRIDPLQAPVSRASGREEITGAAEEQPEGATEGQ